VTFIVLSPIPDPVLVTLRSNAAELSPYVEPDGAVATPEDLFDGSLRDPAAGLPEWLDHPAYRGFVRLVERRIVGQDWLQPPLDPMEGVPPIMVFTSHKGGVGRSTALGVSAAALSAEGFNVLLIDLDIKEAPKFGSLDYFVEDGCAGRPAGG
jgi:Mrp family chromosome partitioning ATPase